MTTYDAILLLVVLGWWIIFRRKYAMGAVVMYYMLGVMVTDIGCAILILAIYHWSPNVIYLPALLMPLGGIAGLGYGAFKGKLRKPPLPATSVQQQ